MTETIERTEGTALAQVAPGALARVKDGKAFNIADLAKLLAGPEPVLAKTEPAPKLPKRIEVTETLKKSLRTVLGVFAKIQPTESRKLEAAELKALTEEHQAISQITTPLGERLTAIAEIIRHHMDHYADSLGLVDEDTIRIAEGIAKAHYLLAKKGEPFEVPVEGFEDSWQQRHVAGKVNINGSKLGQMEKDGQITHDEYLACTSIPVGRRSYDGDRLAIFIKKHPERGLQILTALTEQGAPIAQLFPPKK